MQCSKLCVQLQQFRKAGTSELRRSQARPLMSGWVPRVRFPKLVHCYVARSSASLSVSSAWSLH